MKQGPFLGWYYIDTLTSELDSRQEIYFLRQIISYNDPDIVSRDICFSGVDQYLEGVELVESQHDQRPVHKSHFNRQHHVQIFFTEKAARGELARLAKELLRLILKFPVEDRGIQ